MTSAYNTFPEHREVVDLHQNVLDLSYDIILTVHSAN